MQQTVQEAPSGAAAFGCLVALLGEKPGQDANKVAFLEYHQESPRHALDFVQFGLTIELREFADHAPQFRANFEALNRPDLLRKMAQIVAAYWLADVPALRQALIAAEAWDHPEGARTADNMIEVCELKARGLVVDYSTIAGNPDPTLN